jgi:hypothetical protein
MGSQGKDPCPQDSDKDHLDYHLDHIPAQTRAGRHHHYILVGHIFRESQARIRQIHITEDRVYGLLILAEENPDPSRRHIRETVLEIYRRVLIHDQAHRPKDRAQ